MSERTALSRRTVLRGLGVTLGLPLLEAMHTRAAAPAAAPPLRLLFLYVPMGVDLDEWTPKAEGAGFDLPYTLAPLEKVKGRVLVLSGLQHRREDQAGNPHPRGSSTFLSTAPVGKVDASGFCTDVSIDQLAARRIGRETRLPSLELACQRGIGKHASNISWRGPGSPMGPEVNPRLVFLRLFGDPKGDVCRRAVLDRVLEDARRLRADLGRADQGKLDEYLDAVRSIERQIEATEHDRERRGAPAPALALPEGLPRSHPEHLRLLTDLLVLALRTDATRVATFLYALENGSGVGPVSYRHLGISEDHHGLTHFTDGNRKACLAKIKRIDRFHVEQLAYLLEKMKAIREGEGTLLDSCLVLYGSGMSWGNRHNSDDVPVLLCGGGGGIAGGRHLRYPAGTPLANLHLALLDRVGVRLERSADSTGRLPGLGGVSNWGESGMDGADPARQPRVAVRAYRLVVLALLPAAGAVLIWHPWKPRTARGRGRAPGRGAA